MLGKSTGYFYNHMNKKGYTIGGSTTAATSKMEPFVILVNGFQPLTIITKCSILDVAAVLYPPLLYFYSHDNIRYGIPLLARLSTPHYQKT